MLIYVYILMLEHRSYDWSIFWMSRIPAFLCIVPNAEGVAMADEFFSHSYLPWFGCTTFIRSNWINYVSFTALPLARVFRASSFPRLQSHRNIFLPVTPRVRIIFNTFPPFRARRRIKTNQLWFRASPRDTR